MFYFIQQKRYFWLDTFYESTIKKILILCRFQKSEEKVKKISIKICMIFERALTYAGNLIKKL